jgi:hypothetical protein
MTRSYSQCRLTGSEAKKSGMVARNDPSRVLNGFETGFSFQITGHSRVCHEVKDAQFSVFSHKACSVKGGDGIAFVMHRDPRGYQTLGKNGAGMGYAGLSNALVIELDAWYNAEPESGDLVYDHISVHGAPTGKFVTGTKSSMLSRPMRVQIADGLIHQVKIQYYPTLQEQLAGYFRPTELTAQYMKDAGESRRLGTLVVYYDNMTTPLFAVPINLNVLLQLPDDQAFVVRCITIALLVNTSPSSTCAHNGLWDLQGITAATGKHWERHDIVDWYFCEHVDCPLLRTDITRVRYNPQHAAPLTGQIAA